jgi:hypothetical protein
MSSLLAHNEGSLDRGIRVVVGLGILSQAFLGLHTPWAYLGLIPLVTGAVGTCPLYSVLGFSTCPVRQA